MVEWASGRSERTFNQSAANGRKEPNFTDAARCTNSGSFWAYLETRDPTMASYCV